MLAAPVFDVAGPGVYLLAGGVFFTVFSIGTLVIESLALWLLKWDTFGRSLLAAFLMNLASTICGFILFVPFLLGVNYLIIFLVGLPLSLLIEGGILMLMKKGSTRQNWIGALVANVASYGFLGIALLVTNLL